MVEQTEIDWLTCGEADCIGVQLPSGERCLAHCGVDERATALTAIGESGEVDARGVTFSTELFDQVLTVVPRSAAGHPVIKSCSFEKATFDNATFGNTEFSGDAWFDGATFRGVAAFRGATFGGVVSFGGSTFHADAWFGGATFEGVAGFDGVTFGGVAGFRDVTFCRVAWFGGVTFGGNAGFGNAIFRGVAGFSGAVFADVAGFGSAMFRRDAGFDAVTFGGGTWFDGVTFVGAAGFCGVTFSGDIAFDHVTFRKNAEFNEARFEQTSRFGAVFVARKLMLEDARFDQRICIEASTPVLSCRGARFREGVDFRLRWAQVSLEGVDFSVSSTFRGMSGPADEDFAVLEERAVEVGRRFVRLVAAGERDHEDTSEAWKHQIKNDVGPRPQVLSLWGADVSGLTLSDIDLSDCRFAGAYNLDKLRLEPDVSLATVSARIGRFGFGWDSRQVIADERAWRSRVSGRWDAPPWPAWIEDKPEVLEPGRVAGIYRSLRKGREDSKDEPGAADFYYGEMEMRRRAEHTADSSFSGSSRGLAERALLTVYWLVSGYGLRAWRALACLSLVTVVFALGFHYLGFRLSARPDSYWKSLVFTFQTVLSLSDTDFKLTGWGKLFQGLMRVAGPVLIGLALLALRGRVKR